jgi:PKD repeat protein
VFFWDFGNGNTSSLKNPTAIFLQPQSYTVTLKVRRGVRLP